MPNEPFGKFLVSDCKRIGEAVKKVEQQPVDGAAPRRSAATTDNRLFWSSQGPGIQECQPAYDGSDFSLLSWTDTGPRGNASIAVCPPPIGGNSVSAATLATGTGTPSTGLFTLDGSPVPNPAPQLVFQSFDTTTAPPTPVFLPVSPLTWVTITGMEAGTGAYDAEIGGSAVSARAWPLGEPMAGVNQLCSGRSMGAIVAQTSENPSRPVVFCQAEYQSKVYWFDLVQDGGSAGTLPSFSGGVYTPGSAPSYTYTIKDSSTGRSVVIATGKAPLCGRPQQSSNPAGTRGIGWFNDGGNFVLWDAGER